MTLQERLRQMAAFHEADTGCPTGARHLAWAAESREAADRIAELEALLLTALALHGGQAVTHSEIEWRAAARKALNLARS